MLSNHYPLASSTEFNWVIAALIFIIGVLIRHYFNSKHAGTGNPHWTWLASVVLFIVIIWLSTVPKVLQGPEKVSSAAAPFLAAQNFQEVRDTVMGRCSMCHAAEPSFEGIMHAPKGIRLDTDELIATHASQVYLFAGASHAMPPGNLTQMTDAERSRIVVWYRSAVSGKSTQ